MSRPGLFLVLGLFALTGAGELAAEQPNPINNFFRAKAELLVPTSTHEMVLFAQIAAGAWLAEMENSFALLKSNTEIEAARSMLDLEKQAFIEYNHRRAEIQLLLGFSNAFSGDAFSGDGSLATGSLGLVMRHGYREAGWQEKTMELFDRLRSIGITPQFIFDEARYAQELQAALPHLWP